MNVSYHSVSGKKKRIIEEVQSGPKIRREIQEEVGSDKSYPHTCLDELHSEGLVSEDKEVGKSRASVWE